MVFSILALIHRDTGYKPLYTVLQTLTDDSYF